MCDAIQVVEGQIFSQSSTVLPLLLLLLPVLLYTPMRTEYIHHTTTYVRRNTAIPETDWFCDATAEACPLPARFMASLTMWIDHRMRFFCTVMPCFQFTPCSVTILLPNILPLNTISQSIKRTTWGRGKKDICNETKCVVRTAHRLIRDV